ncbi:RNA polymerase sigma-70 factor [Maribellus comscasis]|uniref:RNA polymerase sigma-70 factor n=1 Tax=Maribellus comscasis TaxID=2681766 RepID=A0A6I6K5G6_9BACT|nr:RNA polymerase sigma-70 factor [Maribellus comscasis]QGY47967.1 RNA polymerase sigma-70 factor [Maribellus comscasis]
MGVDIPLHGFNEIYTTFYKKSYLFVKSYVHDDMVAEDIVSDSLIKLWQQLKMETIDPIAPYLFSILKNRALDHLKHQSVRRDVYHKIATTLERELAIRTASLESSNPQEVFAKEIHSIIEETLKRLQPRTREIFIMSRFEHKSHKEIAKFYHISLKGVEYHIGQAVRELRMSLKDYIPLLGALFFLKL